MDSNKRSPSADAETPVALSDDECLFRASLRQLLSVPPAVIRDVYAVDVGSGFRIVGEAGSGEETVRMVETARPDLLLLDLSMPRMSGLDALRELAAMGDPPPTILLTGTINQMQLLTAIQLGVRGFVLKTTPTEMLFEAIVGVLQGGYWLDQTLVPELLETTRTLIKGTKLGGGPLALGLTTREREILTLVGAGYANKDIARHCSVTEDAVKHHLTRMFDKIGVSNRLELANLAAQRGFAAAQ